jgi:hypothetical protein
LLYGGSQEMKSRSFIRHAGLAMMAILGLIVMSAGTAEAQYYQRYGYGQGSNVAVNNGYQLGYGSGSNDRAYGRSFDIDRHKSYRDADSGRSGSGLNEDAYEQLFRQGFQAGYRDGYYGGQRRGYYNPRNDGYYNNSRYYNGRYYDDDRYERRQRRRYRNRDRIFVIPRY